MIDYFALALCHGLLLIALIRLARRSDVDTDAALEDEAEKLSARKLREQRRKTLRADRAP
ncbi:hypothetical protein A3736_10445 [Erythrobacter sp. HI0063]|uniref:hypothetical protein n=1 Tax=unclassified Erythrobacter TaxID=2633097 RepID=UPI0007C3FEBA|nr:MULTISPECIES: hypothetical protein [unclassified Erythrobacter]KZY55512.1 hypothetical protein A3736_10445 [Erythrobacter sp. HI0063]MBO9511772.1 hypothetical protein [Erythrobacter sp. A6_0]